MPLSSASMGWTMCVGPAHDLDGPDVFADEAADDFDAVAAEVDDGAAAGLFEIPEPVAMGAGVGFTGAGPGYMTQCALLNGGDSLEGLGRVAEVFEIAAKDTRGFDLVHHSFGFGGVAAEGLGAEGWPCRRRQLGLRTLRGCGWGSPMTTVSMSSEVQASVRSVVHAGMSHSSAKALALSSVRE